MEKKLSIISHKKAKSLVEKTAAMIFRGCAIISVLAVVTITGYMIISGTPAIFKEGITGEKALVFNGVIRRKYSYKLENGEKFVTEARLHHEMDLEYNIKCFNEPIMICEYKEDGYSKNVNKLFLSNPYGYYQYFKEIFNQDMKNVTSKKRLYVYKHYILFSVLTGQKYPIKNVNGILNKIMVAVLYIPGKIMTNIKLKK